jgi:ribosome maturation factor RimP
VDAEALVRPLIEAEGLELVAIESTGDGGRKVLRVTVDRPGGIDLDSLTDLSRRVSRHLDAEGFATGPYALEVSSPGIERPLKRPEHFRRAVGDRVKVKTTAPVAGSRSHTGALRGADDDGITLDVDGGEVHIAYADIASARTVVDWDAELKRSNA